MLLLLALASPAAYAATVWTGPTTSFTQSGGTPSDTILAGKVVLTRGGNQVLYNIAAKPTAEVCACSPNSPLDTEWAFGNLSDHASLTYQSLESMRNGNLAALILFQPMVMHIITEDIYLSVFFTDWGQNHTGGFAYTRSTPAVVVSPAVSITSPTNGASFIAPASVPLTANASVNSGTVTNVAFFAGSTSLGHVTISPFSIVGSIPSPGAYALTAVATAGGVSATSAVVNITVVARPTVSITNPASGTVFAAPANVKLSASASVTGGTVTNVSFFNSTTLLGSVQSPPFNLTASGLGASAYTLTAVATASGISATSSVVNISVVSPVPVSASAPSVSNGLFAFTYSANPGLSYVVQDSSDLVNWISLVTNVAASNPALYSESYATNSARFFRIGRQPNP